MAKKSSPPSPEQTQQALLSVVESVKTRHVDSKLYRGFTKIPADKLYSVRMRKSREDRRAPEIPAIGAVIAESEINQFRRQSDVKQLKKAVYAVVSLLESTSRHEPWRDRQQVRGLLGELVIGMEPHPPWLAKLIAAGASDVPARAVTALTGLSHKNWQSSLATIRRTYEFATTPAVDRLPGFRSPGEPAYHRDPPCRGGEVNASYGTTGP